MRTSPRDTAPSAVSLLALVVAVVCALAGCSGPRPHASPATQNTAGQSSTATEADGSLSINGTSRTYRVHVGKSSTQPVPLVIALHGGGGSAQGFEQKTGFDQLADSAGFIVVYPESVTPTDGALRTWNAGDCCGFAARTKVDDVGFIRQLIAHMTATYRIDSRRIYVTGHSNGGMLAYRVACELADTVAAVGVQSATLEYSPCQPSAPVSLVHIHGDADTNVPLAGGRGKGKSGVDYFPPPKAAATIAAADHCAATPEMTDQAGEQTRNWTGCVHGSAVELVTVKGGTHAWMDTSAATIWSFLQAHPRR